MTCKHLLLLLFVSASLTIPVAASANDDLKPIQVASLSMEDLSPIQVASMLEYISNSTNIALLNEASISSGSTPQQEVDVPQLVNKIAKQLEHYHQQQQEFDSLAKLQLLANISQLLYSSKIVAMPLASVTLSEQQSYFITRIDKKSAIALEQQFNLSLPIVMVDGYFELFQTCQKAMQEDIDKSSMESPEKQHKQSSYTQTFSQFRSLSLLGKLDVLDIFAAGRREPFAATLSDSDLIKQAVKLRSGMESVAAYLQGEELSPQKSTDLFGSVKFLVENFRGTQTILTGSYVVRIVEMENSAAAKTGQRMQQTEQSLQKSEQELQQSQQQLAKSESRLQKMEKQLAISKERLAQSKQNLQQAKRALSKSEQQLARYNQKLVSTEQRYSSANSKLEQIKDALGDSERQLRNTERKYKKSQQQLQKIEPQLAKLEDELDQSEDKLRKSERELSKSEEKLQLSGKKLEHLQKALTTTLAKLDNSDDALKKSTRRLDKLEDELEQSEQDIEVSEAKLSRKEQQLQQAEKRLRRSKKDLQKLEMVRANLQKLSSYLN